MGSGVITGDDDQTPDGPHVYGAHERVGRYIESHLFHAAGSPFPRNGRGKGIVQGDLFVGGPFHIGVQLFRFLQADHLGQDLGTGRAGIGCHHLASGFHQTQCYGAVSQENLLFHVNSSFDI